MTGTCSSCGQFLPEATQDEGKEVTDAGITFEEFVFPSVERPGRTSPYEKYFSSWFNGKPWKLNRDTENDGEKLSEVPLPNGTQYRCTSLSMLSILRAHLKQMHKEGKSEFDFLRSYIADDYLVVQATKK